jgi:predicted dehydrogenase
MRFALLGDHPDGVEMARALAESGRHRVIAYTAALSEDILQRWGGAARRVSDMEEVLADPAVEAVIVAGPAAVRPAQLRRALQSERHVLCVHPADDTPEIASEAAMIRNDTGYVLLPLLPEATHPALGRLAEFVQWRAGSRKHPEDEHRSETSLGALTQPRSPSDLGALTQPRSPSDLGALTQPRSPGKLTSAANNR